jgi:hypothetical protein
LITNGYGCIAGKGNVDRIRNVLRQFVSKYEAASARGNGNHLQDDFCGNVRNRIMQDHSTSIFTDSNILFTRREQREAIFYFRVMFLSKGEKNEKNLGGYILNIFFSM